MVQKTPRPRGRPRGFDPDAALRSAGERFRSRGFSATSLDDIVEATGLARPSLYAAFGDKRALYLAALEQVTARTARRLDGLASLGLPLREMVATMLAATIDGYLTGELGPAGCLAVGTASSEAAADPAIAEALRRFVRMEDEKIAECLVAAGSPHPEGHARVLAAVVHSLSVRTRAGATREELERVAADAAMLIAP